MKISRDWLTTREAVLLYVRGQERKHRRTPWKELRRRYGRWPADGDVVLFDPANACPDHGDYLRVQSWKEIGRMAMEMKEGRWAA